MDECKDWYLNPTVTKEVLKHLATVNQGNEDSDRITKQMNLVEVTFDQKTEESVITTTVSVLTHLDEKILLALAKTAHLQKQMVNLLNEKLKVSLRKMYNKIL